MSDVTDQVSRTLLSNSVSFGRLVTPVDIAKAVVFLSTDDSSYIKRAELFEDGGFAHPGVAVGSGGHGISGSSCTPHFLVPAAWNLAENVPNE